MSVPTRTWAQEPAPASAAATSASLAPGPDVNRIFADGKARFEAGDYVAAIAHWDLAYQHAPANAAGRAFRVGIASHLALAWDYLSRQSGRATDVDRAATLLRWHVAEYKALYPPSADARQYVAGMEGWLADLESRRAALWGGVSAVAPAPPVGAPPAPQPSRRAHAQATKNALHGDPLLYDQYVAGRSLVIGGGVMAVAGSIALLSAIAIGANRGVDGTSVLVGGLGVGLVGGGIAMSVVGSSRRNQAMNEARRRVSLAPSGAGLALSGRF
jgi:hypothetical protein